MTQEMLAGLAGVLLSMGFSYIPGLREWYGALDSVHRRLVMLVCIVLAGGGVYLAGCAQLVTTVTCDRTGLVELLGAIVSALVANQAAYMLSPASSERGKK